MSYVASHMCKARSDFSIAEILKCELFYIRETILASKSLHQCRNRALLLSHCEGLDLSLCFFSCTIFVSTGCIFLEMVFEYLCFYYY